jgi:hypothetical protein
MKNKYTEEEYTALEKFAGERGLPYGFVYAAADNGYYLWIAIAFSVSVIGGLCFCL